MKIGVLGAGNIAGVVSRTLSAMEEVQCYAVAARSLERAQTFAAEHGFQKVIGEYIPTPKNAMVKDLYEKMGFARAGENRFEAGVKDFHYHKTFITEE